MTDERRRTTSTGLMHPSIWADAIEIGSYKEIGESAMQVLFVHGMGRSPISAWPMLRRLKKSGAQVSSFFYSVTFEDFSRIVRRLQTRIASVAESGEYVLIGHSLGGVAIRAALASLPDGTRMPSRIFLLGSPVIPSQVAQFLRRNWLFWLLTRDCGQLLSSEERMQNVAGSSVPTTSFVGTRGIYGRYSPFGDQINDGVVTATEIAAPWISEELRVPVVHSLMPSSPTISKMIIDRLESASSGYLTSQS